VAAKSSKVLTPPLPTGVARRRNDNRRGSVLIIGSAVARGVRAHVVKWKHILFWNKKIDGVGTRGKLETYFIPK
jgi:hypothetical protein